MEAYLAFEETSVLGRSSGRPLCCPALLSLSTCADMLLCGSMANSMRMEQWILGALHQEKAELTFPVKDLFDDLVDLYFTRINNYQPLLHRPTFEEAIKDGLHLRDEGFGSVVLLVCAAASRFSEDERVFLEGSDDTHSSGWEWFRQVQLVRKSLLAPPRLYDLQLCAVCDAFILFPIYVQLILFLPTQLTAIFLQSTSAPQACWTVIGVGIRLAQDVGAHRRKVYTLSNTTTVEAELWKRAFW